MTAAPTYDNLLTELSDGVLTVTMNRPDKLNAFNPPLQDDIPPLPVAIAAFKDALTRCREAEERLAQVMTEGEWLK